MRHHVSTGNVAYFRGLQVGTTPMKKNTQDLFPTTWKWIDVDLVEFEYLPNLQARYLNIILRVPFMNENHIAGSNDKQRLSCNKTVHLPR